VLGCEGLVGSESWKTRLVLRGQPPRQACTKSPRFRVHPHENQPWFMIYSHKDLRHNSVL
jgi:hypothetical protein